VKSTPQFQRVHAVYFGSDGAQTRALYVDLERAGVLGVVAVNLFRAQKSSERAKVYRGGIRGQGSYRSMAYERKNWALSNLCDVLQVHAQDCSIAWGWGIDAAREYHRHVLYVDLPEGQVSFHAEARGKGPDYPGQWDGVPHMSAGRVCAFVAGVLEQGEACAKTSGRG
jgi:hypothetical protein